MNNQTNVGHHIEHTMSVSGLGVVHGAIEKLREEHVVLEETIAAKDRQIHELKKVIQAIHDKLKTANSKSNSRIESLVRKLSANETEYSSLQREVIKDKQQLKLLQDDLSFKDTDLAKLRGMASQNTDFRFANEKLQNELAKQQTDSQTLSSQLSEECMKVKSLLVSYEKIKDELTWLKTELEQSATREEELKRALTEAEDLRVKGKVDNEVLRQQMQQLNRQVQEMFTGEELRNNVDAVKIKLQAAEHRADKQKRQLTEMRQQLEDAKSEKHKMQMDGNAKDRELSKVVAEANETREQLEDLSSRLAATNEHVENARNSLEKNKQKVITYELQITQLRDELQSANEKDGAKNANIGKLKKAVALMRDELIAREKETRRLEVANEDLKQSVCERETQLSELRGECKVLNAHIEETTTQVSAKYDALDATIVALKEKNDRLAYSSQQLTEEIHALHSALREKDSEHNEVLQRLKQLKWKLTAANAKTFKLENERRELKLALERSRQTVAQREADASEFKSEMHSLRAHFSERNKEATAKSTQLTAAKSQLQKVCVEMGHLREEKHSAEESAKLSAERMRELELQLSTTEEKLKNRTEKLNGLMSSMSLSSNSVREFKFKLEEAKLTNEKIGAELSGAKEETEGFKGKLQAATGEMSLLKRELAGLRSDNDELKDSLQRANDAMDTETAAMSTLQSENEAMLSQSEALKRELAQKKERIGALTTSVREKDAFGQREHQIMESTQSEMGQMKQQIVFQETRHNKEANALEALKLDSDKLKRAVSKLEKELAAKNKEASEMRTELLKAETRMQHCAQSGAEKDTQLALAKEESAALELDVSELREELRVFKEDSRLRDEEMHDIQYRIDNITTAVTAVVSKAPTPRVEMATGRRVQRAEVIATDSVLVKRNTALLEQLKMDSAKIKSAVNSSANRRQSHLGALHEERLKVVNTAKAKGTYERSSALKAVSENASGKQPQDVEQMLQKSEAQRTELKQMIDSVNTMLVNLDE